MATAIVASIAFRIMTPIVMAAAVMTTIIASLAIRIATISVVIRDPNFADTSFVMAGHIVTA